MNTAANPIVQLVLFHLRTMFRNKVAFAFNLVIPLVFLGVFGAMFAPASERNQQLQIGLASQDSPRAQAVYKHLLDSGWFSITSGDEATLRKELAAGKVSVVVVVPPAERQASQPVLLLEDESSNTSKAASGIVQSELTQLSLDLLDAPPPLKVTVESLSAASEYNIFDFLMPGQVTFMFLGAGIVTVALSLAQQRQSGSMRHLFSTPLSMGHWMTGRVVANLVLCTIQSIALFVAARVMFDVRPPANITGTVVLLLLSALMTLSIGMAIGTLSKTQESATVLAQILSIGLAFLGNAMLPMNGAPSIVQILSKALPTSYMTHSLRLVMMQGKGLPDVALDIAVLVGFTALCLGVATHQLRKQFLVS